LLIDFVARYLEHQQWHIQKARPGITTALAKPLLKTGIKMLLKHTTLLRLFLPSLGCARYVMLRSQDVTGIILEYIIGLVVKIEKILNSCSIVYKGEHVYALVVVSIIVIIFCPTGLC